MDANAQGPRDPEVVKGLLWGPPFKATGPPEDLGEKKNIFS